MGEQFEELAKALARGTSRRVALKRFAAGLAGAALANVFAGRTAQAQNPVELAVCRIACAVLENGPGQEYSRCLRTCADCVRHGGTPIVLNDGDLVCGNGS
jgi:hypothetical protein